MPDEKSTTTLLHDLFLEGGWDSSAPAGPCLEDETIGALLAGTLPDAERERAEEHVASCEQCYRAYATGMALLIDLDAEEEGDDEDREVAAAAVIAFAPKAEAAISEGRQRIQPAPSAARTALQFLPWAAAVALITISSWWFLREPGLPSLAEVVAALPETAVLEPHLLRTDPQRGPGDPENDLPAVQEAFQAGGSAFDLWLAGHRRNVEDMKSFSLELADLLKNPNRMTGDSILKALEQLNSDLRSTDVDSMHVGLRAEELAQKTEKLYEKGPASSFALGRYVEVSRLMARTGNPNLFARQTLAEGLERWRKENPSPANDVGEELASLTKALRAQPLDLKTVDQELDAFQQAFGFHRVSLNDFDDLAPDGATASPPPQPQK